MNATQQIQIARNKRTGTFTTIENAKKWWVDGGYEVIDARVVCFEYTSSRRRLKYYLYGIDDGNCPTKNYSLAFGPDRRWMKTIKFFTSKHQLYQQLNITI